MLHARFPFRAKTRKKVVGLNRNLILFHVLRRVLKTVCKRIRSKAEIHVDRSGAEDYITVTFTIHLGFMSLTKEARITVANVVFFICGRSWWTQRRLDSHPFLLSLSLHGLQLWLRSDTRALKKSLLPEVSMLGAPDGKLFLLHFSKPGKELVSVTLRHFRISQETVTRLRFPCKNWGRRLYCKDSHVGRWFEMKWGRRKGRRSTNFKRKICKLKFSTHGA